MKRPKKNAYGFLLILSILAFGIAAEAKSKNKEPIEIQYSSMDVNSDRVITRDEWRGSAQSFRTHDWNGDGVLSGKEVQKNLQSADILGARFEELDVNRDGIISRGEWSVSAAQFRLLDDNGDNVLTRVEFSDSKRAKIEQFVTLDKNGDGVVSRKEWNQSTGAFKALDDDGNGTLTRNEFFNPGINQATSAVNERFAQLDIDRNGLISRSEWKGGSFSFAQLDRNRNGSLTRDEFRNSTYNRRASFAEMDANNDGRISREEWRGNANNFAQFDRNNDNVVTLKEYESRDRVTLVNAIFDQIFGR